MRQFFASPRRNKSAPLESVGDSTKVLLTKLIKPNGRRDDTFERLRLSFER